MVRYRWAIPPFSLKIYPIQNFINQYHIAELASQFRLRNDLYRVGR